MNKKLKTDSNAVSVVTETMIALSIAIVVLAVFLFFISNVFSIYTQRDDIDIQEMSIGISNLLTDTTGIGTNKASHWETDAENVTVLGLKTMTLLDYGLYNTTTKTSTTHYTQGSPSTCFLAGTQILMADGSYKYIEHIYINDTIQTYNLSTGLLEPQNVTYVFFHPAEEMTPYYLVINNYLRVTPNHNVYTNNQWIAFEDITVGDYLNGLHIYSIEKVFSQHPTYNLEVHHNNNFFVKLINDSVLAHNQQFMPAINPQPWVLSGKQINLDDDFSPISSDYYIHYTTTKKDTVLFYQIFQKTNNPSKILDNTKIHALSQLDYSTVKQALGLSDEKYNQYNVNITIRYENGTIFSYGASFQNTNIISSYSSNVLIFHRPHYHQDTIRLPYHQKARITVRIFLGGSI
jgi:hypothetical protein